LGSVERNRHVNEWIQTELQKRAVELARANAKRVEEYEAEWVEDGNALSKRGGDGYCLKVGVLRAHINSLLRWLEHAELYVPGSEEA
jgi:hypothetical protein